MNEPERAELARLKDEQARLEKELRLLSEQLRSFEQRIVQTASPEAGIPLQIRTFPPTPASLEPTVPQPAHSIEMRQSREQVPPSVPPLIPLVQPPGHFTGGEQPATPVTAATQMSVHQTSVPSGLLKPGVEQGPPASGSSGTVRSIPIPPPLESTAAAPAHAGSFEMRLGTYWLVRIGIVMVLTGLVFFGNLAYQNYISRLGPGGKISLLYVVSAVLLVAGWWWQRAAVKETLKHYAQVLFAGGLAALYFTTYAAHHIEPLRVIQNPVVDGVLLLACAGFMIWAAERKKSEVLAFFAVGLAYYTSIITRVGYFTLWSNLVLSATAVFFLVRNRWAALSFGSLVATYVAYGFWRFFNGTDWHWASPAQGLWSGTAFLMMYWLVLTSAVFLSKDQKFAGQNRASFLTLNNGAFFSLFLLTMLQVQEGGFWKFALVYGGVLVGLAAVAEVMLSEEPLAANAYLTQGLLLVTVGFISKFAGLQLALILALESVLLLMMGQQRKNLILLIASYVAAALAVGWGMDGLKQFDTRGLWLGIGLGSMMMVNAILTHRQLTGGSRTENTTDVLRPQPSYFTVLALATWAVVTWDNTDRDIFPLVLAAESVLLTFSIYALRVREVPLLSQGFMLVAQAAWLINWLDRSPPLPSWNPMLLLVLSLTLSHWWPRQNAIRTKASTGVLWPALYALGINLVVYVWLAPKENTSMWLFTTSLLAVGLTIYGVATRAWFVAAGAQLFLAVSVCQFGVQLWHAAPPWQFALAPIAGLCLLSFGTVQWFKRRPDSNSSVREPLLQIALIYRWVGLVMSIAWVCEYVAARERIWVLALPGVLIFLWSGWRRSREGLLFGAAFTATAVALFWPPMIEGPTVYIPNLMVILALLGQREMARRLPQRYPLDAGIHNAVIVIGGLSLWLFVSRWVLEIASGFYLTASWSLLALALFSTGWVLRERMYRWIGLGVLACALGRVVIFDVWKLETVYRILSFMALGIVLLVLGFIYSKYQEKIKEWL